MSEWKMWKINNLGADDWISGPMAENSDPIAVIELSCVKELVELAQEWRRTMHDFSPTAVMIDATLEKIPPEVLKELEK